MKQSAFLAVTLAASLLLSPVGSLAYAQKTMSSDVVEVLEIMRDSRKVRDLKSAPMAKQAAFTQTLRDSVYQPAYKEVQKHLWQQPEYQKMRLVVQEFRTPGANPNSVNTDNDLRVLVEVEPGHWREVPTKKWADKYYEAFAKQSGFQADPKFKPEKATTRLTPEESLKLQYRQHAQQYRQLATDQYHVEASRDYTDQKLKYQDLPDADARQHGQAKARIIQSSTIRQARDAQGELRYHPDGAPMFESESHISAVKKAQANADGTFKPLSERAVLRDAEGLSHMYYEKGHEQLRKAQDLEKKLRETPGLSRSERARIQDQVSMHKTEAAAQIRKGVTSLQELRGAYERQGFDVGKPRTAFEEAGNILSSVDGSSRTDIAQVEAKLKKLGYQDLNDFNAKMQGQIESLKLARPVASTPSPADSANQPASPAAQSPNKHLVRAGKVADVAGVFLGVMETHKQMSEGQHLFFNLDHDDDALEQAGKIAGANVVDIMGFTAGFQSGLAADDKEKERILKAIREGKSVSPVLSFVRASSEGVSDVLWNMATAPVMGPFELAKEMVGATMAAHNERQAVAIAQEQERQARNARWADLEKPFAPDVAATPAGLGNRVWRFLHQVNGESLPESVKPGQMVAFSISPVGDWNDTVRVEWLVKGELYQSKLANEANASSVRFSTSGLAGSVPVAVRLVDANSGKVLAHMGDGLIVEGPPVKPSPAAATFPQTVASSAPNKTTGSKQTASNTPSDEPRTSSTVASSAPQTTSTGQTSYNTPSGTKQESAHLSPITKGQGASGAGSPNQTLQQQELQIRQNTLAATKKSLEEADAALLQEMQKVGNSCKAKMNTAGLEAESSRLMSEKAALAQEEKALMARGYVIQAEADNHNARNAALNARIQAFNTKNTAAKAARQEYEQFLKTGRSDVGQALLMAKNLSCAAGSGYNHEAASRAFLRMNELKRQLAQQEAEVKKLATQLQGQGPKGEFEYYQVEYVGIAGYVGPENVSKTPTKDYTIPRTICGATYYDDNVASENFNKNLREASNPVFILLKNGQEVSRCAAK